MTFEWIIERLGITGSGTKQEVLYKLKNASLEELEELSKSVNEKLKEKEHERSKLGNS